MKPDSPYSAGRLPSVPRHCPMERLLLSARKATRPSLRQWRELPWRQASLVVALGDCLALELHSGVSRLDAWSALSRAIATWNAIGLPIDIQLLDVAVADFVAGQIPDVIVEWYVAHADPELMFVGTVHAHADYPPGNTLFGGPPLPLHFNASVLWGIEMSGSYDIETIALHELAHVLGLIYHSGPGTILYDAIPPAPLGVLHYLDFETITRARQLYTT